MGYPGTKDRSKNSLSMQEREKFELALIASPSIKVGPQQIMFKTYKFEAER